MGHGPGGSPMVNGATTIAPTAGEMAEWLKAHGWNPCLRLVRNGGSNPPLSACIRTPSAEPAVGVFR